MRKYGKNGREEGMKDFNEDQKKKIKIEMRGKKRRKGRRRL